MTGFKKTYYCVSFHDRPFGDDMCNHGGGFGDVWSDTPFHAIRVGDVIDELSMGRNAGDRGEGRYHRVTAVSRKFRRYADKNYDYVHVYCEPLQANEQPDSVRHWDEIQSKGG